jgi:hypothetical protein
MKKLLYTLICIVLLNGLVYAQFNLQFIEQRNDGYAGGQFDVRIQIQSLIPFALGDADLFFQFNNTGLSPDFTLTPLNFDIITHPGYGPMQVLPVAADEILVDILYFGPFGELVDPAAGWVDVAIVDFTILDPAQTSSCSWNVSLGDVLDDTGLPLIPNSLTPLDVSLPVTLTSFTARVSSDLDVTLKWITESEINNQGFEVYRSDKEEGTYDILSSYTSNDDLLGQGNSSTKHTYTFTDKTVMRGNTYWYKICDVDVNGVRTYHGSLSIVVESGNTVSMDDPNFIPDKFQLSQNYPNPFNPETRIRVSIPDEKDRGEITLTIYDVMGRKVKTLFQGYLEPGTYGYQWNGSDDLGRQVSGGIYFYYLKCNKFHQVKKMIFMK